MTEPQETTALAYTPRTIAVAMVAYGLSGTAALTYEIAWMRELSSMFGATAYASGILLAAFMTGLGLGALLGSRVARTADHPLRSAAHAELAVALCSLITLVALRVLPGTYFDLVKMTSMSGAAFLALQFAVAFIVMLPPTIAMGATYPLAIEALARRQALGNWAGRLYSTNTAGAIAGSLMTSFLIIPLVGLKGALVTAAALSSIAALVFGALSTRTGARPLSRSAEFALVPAVLLAVLLVPSPTGAPLGIGQVYFYESSEQYRRLADASTVLYEEEGVYSRVTVYQDPWGVRTLANGALDEGNSDDYDRTTTTLLALGPTASLEEHELGARGRTRHGLHLSDVRPARLRSRDDGRDQPGGSARGDVLHRRDSGGRELACHRRRRARAPAHEHRDLRRHHLGAELALEFRRGGTVHRGVHAGSALPPQSGRRLRAVAAELPARADRCGDDVQDHAPGLPACGRVGHQLSRGRRVGTAADRPPGRARSLDGGDGGCACAS